MKKVQTHAIQWTVAITIALIVSVAFVTLTQAQPPFKQRFVIRQSHGVSASGTVTFTKNGTVIGGPFTVHCPVGGPGYGDYMYYEFNLPQKPDDITWNITINWSGACGNPAHNADPWTGTNQPWPKTYTKTHTHSPEEWNVSFEESPLVGGVYIPVDKLGLLALYIGLASTILVATAATAIYVKRRNKKQ